MKTVFTIAEAELRKLFYSPIAWLLLLVFIIQCGNLYIEPLERMIQYQQQGNTQPLRSLTSRLFGLPFGIFIQVLSNLYLYVPLLTMGLMSREISTGTIKLLYSSPLKIKQVILGKYLAVVIYCFLLIIILALCIASCFFNVWHADIGLLLSGLLGIFLLLCTYAAIGLFMSCLTSYQVVAALSTLVTFALLNYVGNIGKGIDYVRNVTYFLSISEHTDNMLMGLITTNDVSYFILIICAFILFCIIKLQAERESKSQLTLINKYGIVVISALLIGYFSDVPQNIGYCDTTATKTQTTSPAIQTILSKMNSGPLEVTAYVNLFDETFYLGSPQSRLQSVDLWKPYIRFKPDIKFKYVYYYDTLAVDKRLLNNYPGKSVTQIAVTMAKINKLNLTEFLAPAQIRKLIDLKAEKSRYILELKYQGKKTFLRAYNDNERVPSSQEVGAAFKRLVSVVPKIAFLQGEDERISDKLSDRDYGSYTNQPYFRYSLVNQGFDVENISLKNRDIPRGIASLVIADPKIALDKDVELKIQRYINDGGNLLIAGEPASADILKPILSKLGVRFLPGTLVQQDKNNPPYLLMPQLTSSALQLSGNLIRDFKEKLPVSMPGAAALAFDNHQGFKVSSLITSDSSVSWLKKGKINSDSIHVVFDPKAGDLKGSFTTALGLSRSINRKQQRIIITGDADFLSNSELSRADRVNTANFELATDIFGWFTYGQFPVDISRPESPDNKVNATDSTIITLKILFFGMLPAALILFGGIFLLRRRRK